MNSPLECGDELEKANILGLIRVTFEFERSMI
ncbi:hypothetical protein FOYG_09743 [Fusarium oxysporum NRRL 32931]|uniref:Uncharacterized protein n=1 Tax=Fusarium oxysporum NRRL 32931 TaxID=660029 RepID=W9I804_FUSOX|nr:hypothetical protein FOYG_09743 [Fusarium oxysporum NRRL 32931]